jgi:indolepyruvate ferredoxin oxidoreductase
MRQQKLMREHDVFFLAGLNEDLAATAVFGAQLMHALPGARYDGVMGMWFGKAPGVDRSVDAFRHGLFRGIAANGGILAVAGDDPTAKSSMLPNDSLFTYYGLMMPTICPSDVQDVIDLGLHGFMCSRISGLAVGMKLVTDIADSAGTVTVGPDRVRPVVPSIDVDGKPFTPSFEPNHAGFAHRETERLYMEGRLELARAYGRANQLNPILGAREDAVIALIASGKTYLDLMEALHLLDIESDTLAQHGIRVMKVGMPFPMDPEDLRDLSRNVSEVVVLEEKRSFIETFLKDALFALAERPRVVGKTDETGRTIVPEYGGLRPEMIAAIVAERLDMINGDEALRQRLAAVTRPVVAAAVLPISRRGHFCSGCPHTTSLKTPAGMIVGGGIGCHTMAITMERPEFGDIVGFTQMGGEGAQWVGTAPFTDTGHFIQNLGDGTFAHSGSLAIRFAVSAGTHITYKLLFNSAVAMTGGQDIVGGKALQETVQLLLAEGVKQIIITTNDSSQYHGLSLPKLATVRGREDILDAQRELAAVPGVTVLIHDERCAIEKRRLRRRGILPVPARSVFINERVCEGCGDCGKKSSCLSVIPVETEFGRKTQIHQSSCSRDLSCLEGDCPSFITVKRTKSAEESPRPRPSMPAVSIPDPGWQCSPEHFELHLSGIGGTGVITVNQILGTAAAMGGRSVRVLDQFGGSQKAGAVTSNLKVSSRPMQRSNTISDGAADALLVFDMLVASQPENLAKANPAKTVAVVSTHKVPTGSMIVNPRLEFPTVPVFAKAIDANTRAEMNTYVDAQDIAERLLGDHMATNLFLTGISYQKGLIPLPAEHIEHAIHLNGVAVDMNQKAFRWGRLLIAHPEEVQRALHGLEQDEPALTSTPGPDPRVEELISWADGELRRMLEVRGGDLIGYQSFDYARKYAEFVRRVRQAETRVGEDDALSRAVAGNLYKLMAYKDEYEVARLHLDAAANARIAGEFGDGAKIYWHLHPPMLRALGVKRKLVLGQWFAPAFWTLRAMRRVRGTPADIFGYAKVRRVERRLVAEYVSTMERALGLLSPENLFLAVELAALPDMVRGYEDIKLSSVKEYDDRRVALLDALAGSAAAATRPVVSA